MWCETGSAPRVPSVYTDLASPRTTALGTEYRLVTHKCRYVYVPILPKHTFIKEVCPEGVQPRNMKNRYIHWRRYKIQETLYIAQRHLSLLQSRHLGTSHSSPNRHQLPCHIFLNLITGLKISSLSKVIFILGKARSHRVPNLGCRGAESPERFDVLPKNCMGHDAWAGTLLWWSCPSPVAHNVGLLSHLIVSMEECSSLTHKLMQIHCSTGSGILNATATQCTCSLNSVYCPHWLVQWSRHCSYMRIPVHSPWLPGYIDVMQTILIVLTMAGLSPDRPRI